MPVLKQAWPTLRLAREFNQPFIRKLPDFPVKNCQVSSQIVAEFHSAEIGV
jgi:hypothetical protein